MSSKRRKLEENEMNQALERCQVIDVAETDFRYEYYCHNLLLCSFRVLLELSNEESFVDIEQEQYKYRKTELPKSLKDGMVKLRMIPSFIRKKIDALKEYEVIIISIFLN